MIMSLFSTFLNILLGCGVTQGSNFPFPTECGINYIEPENVEDATRIVGGFEAVPGSWPWQAYILWRDTFECGGTLIHPQWVLSAAHCFYGDEDPAIYKIVLGEHDDSIEEGWEQVIEVEKVIVHPQYDEEAIDYDFTLVKLARPVELNDHVAPACFPEENANLETTFPPEKVCVVTGWGSIDPDGTMWGPVLKQDYAQLYSNEECGKTMEHPNWITARMICAGFRLTGSEDPERCMTLGFGDSGGPLVCKEPETGRWTHVGAVSWAEFCYKDRYTPGVYANTINMRQWVVDMLETN